MTISLARCFVRGRGSTTMAPNADRDLLFGIIALQMDFITRDQLIAAMNAWVLEKNQPLADMLVKQRALQSRHRALLEPMVDAHIEQHGDAQHSLAAVSAGPSSCEALAAIPDADVQASLGHVRRPQVEPEATQSWVP